MARVALLPSLYLPSLGGVEELTRHLALTLSQRGHDVEVWAPATMPGSVQSENLDGLTVRRFDYPLPRKDVRWLPGAAQSAWRSLTQMRRAAAEFKPDVLHVQCFGPNGIYATALSVTARVPLVVTLQGETVMDDHDTYDRSATLRTGLRLAFRRASAVTGCSQFTLDDSERRFGLSPEISRVIFNGVDLGLAAYPTVTKLNPDVFALGRIVDKKGFDLLIRAFALVVRQRPGARLALAGDGRARQELVSLASDLGLSENVCFLGRVSREEVASLMRQSNVFVMPSRVEPFGIVILEAWAAGTPVIASNRGGPPEFVDDGRTGLLADPFNTEELAAAISRVLGDNQLQRYLGQSGKERVSDFDWSRIAEQYEAIYAGVGESPVG